MTASLSFFNFTTFIVILAAFLDICANLLLAASGGFHRKFAGIGALVLVGAAFYCLSLAVQKMDLAVAYALWGSFGILGSSLGVWLFFRQRLSLAAFLGMAVLICGMLLLKLG